MTLHLTEYEVELVCKAISDRRQKLLVEIDDLEKILNEIRKQVLRKSLTAKINPKCFEYLGFSAHEKELITQPIKELT